MRVITWTDDEGYRHRAYIRDGDREDRPDLGVPADIPDLDALDWQAVKRDLHNILTDRGLVTWADVQASQNGIHSAIQAALAKRLVQLYRQQETTYE